MGRLALFLSFVFSLSLLGACAAGGTDTQTDGDVTDEDTDADIPTDDEIPEDEGEELGPDIVYDFHSILPIPQEGYLADPHVIRIGKRWYLYGTHSMVSFEVWYSDDLAHWEQGPTIWAPSQPWQTEGELCGIWAPHVHVADTGYYLYYSANCRIGVAWSDSPLGPFEDVYEHPLVGNGHGGVGDGNLFNDLIRDWNNLAIDAFVLERENGELFFYYTGFTPLSTIYAQRMENLTTVSGEPVQLLDPDVSSWEFLIREGAWVMERKGVIHLMYSGNLFERVEYGIGVATAPDPLGPFTRDLRSPILRANLETGFYGPGHHSVVPGAYDDLLIFYHTKVDPEEGEGRLVRYGPLWFNEAGAVEVEQP